MKLETDTDLELNSKIRICLQNIFEKRPEKPITKFIELLRQSIVEESSGPSTMSSLQIHHKHFIFERTDNIEKHYKLLETIGEGATSKTVRCTHYTSGEERAVKIINKDFFVGDELLMIPQEIDALKEMDHPHIIKPYQIFEDQRHLYIVTELCTGGELFDYIISQDSPISELEISRIMRQILSGLSFCNSKNIMHRDLKPENILLDITEKGLNIKIIDFGTAISFENESSISTLCGTPYYIAPEVIRKNYDYRCDIWSAGIIFHILLVGYPPFVGATDLEVIRNILKGKFSHTDDIAWDIISDQAKDLLIQMLQYDPNKRISYQEALNHPFLSMQNITEKSNIKQSYNLAITNMIKYNSTLKLQKAAISFIANQVVSKKEKEELSEIFTNLDVNGDGTLSANELREGIATVYGSGYPNQETELAEIMDKIDIDQDQRIAYSEFVMAAIDRRKIIEENKILQAFKAFDINEDGVISAPEIKKILGVGQRINEEVWKMIIDEVDTNGDGIILFEEFKNMLFKFIE